MRFLLETTSFRCYVSFQEGSKSPEYWLYPSKWPKLAHLGHLEGKPDNRILKGDENDHPSPGTMASFQQQITGI